MKLKGSYTVEAGVIVSLTMLIIMALLFLGMMLSDRLTAYETALYFVNQAEGEVRVSEASGSFEGAARKEVGIRASEWKDRFLETVNERMLLVKIEDVEFTIDARAVTLKYRGSAGIHGGAAVRGILAPFCTIEEQIERRRRQAPEEFVRMCRGIIWRDGGG